MKLVLRNEKALVVDNLFSEEHFEKIWHYVQNENYTEPHSGGWIKVWRLTDSMPMGGPEYCSSRQPFGNDMTMVLAYVVELASLCKEYLGDWNEIILRPYLYPRGTKLSWHNDGDYLGAMVIYTHPQWGATWGGELMIAETNPDSQVVAPHLDHRKENEFLGEHGIGTYITAKPNRAVVTRKNVWHQINRVDADAGDSVRSSIVAFFSKNKSLPEELPE